MQLMQLCNLRQEFPLHIAMMDWRILLLEIICQVCFTRPPINAELPLLGSIQEPLKLHIHQFCALRADSGVNYPLHC